MLAAAVVVFQRGDEGRAAVLATIQAKLRGDGVIHASFRDAASGQLTSEEWLDKATGATRRVDYGPDGRPERVQVQRGLQVVSWFTRFPEKKSVHIALDPLDPAVLLSSNILRTRRMLEVGRARIVGERSARGRATWEVELDTDSAGESLRTVVEVDKADLLPVRISAWVAGGAGSLSIESREVASERVDRSLFALPSDWFFRDESLRYQDLGELPFRVFTLGRSYRGVEFSFAVYQRHNVSSDSTYSSVIGTLPELFLGYTRGGRRDAEPLIQLTEQDARTEDAKQRLQAYRGGTRIEVTIEGRPIEAYLLDRESASGPEYFALVADETLIKGLAHLPRSEVVAMLGELRAVPE